MRPKTIFSYAKKISSDFGIPFRCVEENMDKLKTKKQINKYIMKILRKGEDPKRAVTEHNKKVIRAFIRRFLLKKYGQSKLARFDVDRKTNKIIEKISEMNHFEIDNRRTNEKALSFKSISPIVIQWTEKKTKASKSLDLGYIGFSIPGPHINMFFAYRAGDNVVGNIFHPHINGFGSVCFGNATPAIARALRKLDLATIDRLMYQLLTTYNKESAYATFEDLEKGREMAIFAKSDRYVAVFLNVIGSKDPRISKKDIFREFRYTDPVVMSELIEKSVGFVDRSTNVRKMEFGDKIKCFEISYPSLKRDGSPVDHNKVFGAPPTFLYRLNCEKAGASRMFDDNAFNKAFAQLIINDLAENKDKTDFFDIIKPKDLCGRLQDILYNKRLIVDIKYKNGRNVARWNFERAS